MFSSRFLFSRGFGLMGVGIIFFLTLSGVTYAAISGVRLTNMNGIDFATFFRDDSVDIGIDASSFHTRINNTYLSNPTDGYNYIRGKTYLGNDTIVATASGNIGIGNTAPTINLDIYSNTTIPIFRIGTPTHALYGGAGTGATIPWLGSSTNSDFALVSNSIARMLIGSGGNVGIGTSTPLGKLDVRGEVYFGANSRGRLIQSPSGDPMIQLNTGAIGFGVLNTTGSTINFWVADGGNVGIGTSSPATKLSVSGSVTATAYLYSSDISLKQDIVPLQNSLKRLLQIQGYSFAWKDTKRKDVGVIAQEIEKVFPETIFIDPNTGLKSVEYGNLIAPVIESIREQQQKIELQDKEIESLRQEIRSLKQQLR